MATTTINGTSGNDLLNEHTATTAVVVNGGAGSDTLIGSSQNDTLNGGAGNDHLQGGAGNDTLAPGTGVDIMQGGLGNDSFNIRQQDYTTGSTKEIIDFGGEGGWNSTNNDFLHLSGFGTKAQGTTLTFSHIDGSQPTLQYYTIHDGLNGQDYLVAIQMSDGTTNHLGTSDYNFY